jgi:carbonic anhydrase
LQPPKVIMQTLAPILERNRNWARQRWDTDPGYFTRLSNIQNPEYLWIGCADSRVPANVITGLEPGEVFVHRNVANIVSASDMNCMSVLQYAIEHLNVRHIIVVGHYGCGGVRAALDQPANGLVDYWLEPVRRLAREHEAELAELAERRAREDRLCELNVCEQVRNVSQCPIIQRAWSRGEEINIHGWIYGLDNGLLHDLGCGHHHPDTHIQG